jgi:hypothetical protein
VKNGENNNKMPQMSEMKSEKRNVQVHNYRRVQRERKRERKRERERKKERERKRAEEGERVREVRNMHIYGIHI